MLYRQGDVLLRKVATVPTGGRRLGEHRVVLAEGEATGHAHVLTGSTLVLWAAGEQRYVTLAGPGTLVHEEHGAIAVRPGTYEVVRQREYTPQEIRRVAD